MKKKRTVLSESLKLVYSDEKIKINKSEKDIFFEIGTEITTDISEAVVLMMSRCESSNEIWDLELETEKEIEPSKALFWLTGGIREWKNLENYNKPWSECHIDFQEEFGILIVNIVKKSKKLSDIRDDFFKYLNLPILYDFAISKNLVK